LATFVFIFIISASGCISSCFLQLFVKTLLIALTGYAASAASQRSVCQILSYLQAFNLRFRKSGSITKSRPQHLARVYNQTLHPTANRGAFFETLSFA
jgi:hypothetical protein